MVMKNNEELVGYLAGSARVLKTPRIQEAFKAVDRADFVVADYHAECYEDYPLSIGHGQTISQPSTVAFMLELLEPRWGQKILDIGCGSGWTTALLANIAGDEGSVIGLERIPELVAFGKRNLAKYRFLNANIEQAGDALGKESQAPFDRILVSAGARKLPEALVAQLALGGILVAPVGNAIVRIEKRSDGTINRQVHEGFVFVPLIEA